MFVVLIRHGETDYNKEGIVQGNEVDPPLNECGERQAIETGKFIKDKFNFDVVYSSPLKRTMKTTELILENIKIKKRNIIKNEGLLEQSKGIFSGLKKQEIKDVINNNPKLLHLYKKIKENSKSDLESLLFIYSKTYAEYNKLVNQEGWPELEDRSIKVFNEIVKSNFGKNILIVSHGSFIAALIRKLFNTRDVKQSTIKTNNKKSGNCTITVIEIDENNNKELILSFNNLHLTHLYEE